MTHVDLAIIGSGSGNSLVTPDFDDRRVAIIEESTYGGTCLNVGCIPTKMYVYAADVAQSARDSARYGVDASVQGVRWPDIRDRVFGRIDPISAGGKQYRQNSANTEVYSTHASFAGPKTLKLATGETLTADQIVIAAGSHPVVPEVITASGVPFHTSATVMRLESLPASMVILGGGYIAAEFAHVFSALGVEVTLVVRGTGLLRQLDADLSSAFTDVAREQWDVRLGVHATAARETDNGVTLELSDGSAVSADVLLVATGRAPSTQNLNAAAAGVDLHPDGRVIVDEFGRTSAAEVWALGDVSSQYQLKHVANHEARIVAHNLVHPEELRAFDHRFVPAAVFTHPQLASVGLTEQQAVAAGQPFVTATQRFGDTAYGWAMEDTVGICKLIADPRTGLLLGAHLMGHQASNLIQPLIQAMSFGQPVTDVARGQYWIHPALMEVVENALLKLDLG